MREYGERVRRIYLDGRGAVSLPCASAVSRIRPLIVNEVEMTLHVACYARIGSPPSVPPPRPSVPLSLPLRWCSAVTCTSVFIIAAFSRGASVKRASDNE